VPERFVGASSPEERMSFYKISQWLRIVSQIVATSVPKTFSEGGMSNDDRRAKRRYSLPNVLKKLHFASTFDLQCYCMLKMDEYCDFDNRSITGDRAHRHATQASFMA
jgi:hypothetical protein